MSQVALQSARNATLDGLRAVAALSVAAVHTLHFVITPYGDTGNFGVLLFFLLSGYCIVLTFGSLGPRPVRGFLIRRAFRLYPAYWVAVLVSAAVSSEQIPINQILANLTMMQTALRVPDINGVFWTLFLELCFYTGIAFLLALKIENRMGVHLGMLVVLAVGTLAGAIIRRATGLHLPFSHPMLFSVFTLGGLICIYHRQGKKLGWIIPTAVAYLSVVVAGSYVAYGTGGFLSDFSPKQYFGSFAFAVVVFVAILDRGWLSWPWLAYLGRISYCIYLFHVPVYHGIVLPLVQEGVAAGMLAIILTIVVSAIIHEFLEKPMIDWGRRLSKGRSAPLVESVR